MKNHKDALLFLLSLIVIPVATPFIDSIYSTSVIAIMDSKGKYGIEKEREGVKPSRRMN
jgi:hypothetical protein